MIGILAQPILTALMLDHLQPGLAGELEQPGGAAVGRFCIRIKIALLRGFIEQIGKIYPRAGAGLFPRPALRSAMAHAKGA